MNSYEADTKAYMAMFGELGLKWGREELDKHYSPDWYVVYRAAGISEEHWDRADATWRRHYRKHRSKLMSGARSVLRQLGRQYELGLVTSGDRERVARQLRGFALTRMFRARVCGGDTKEKKPHPAPLRLALQKIKLRAEDCVYVGDTPEDLAMAGAVGMRAIAVLGCFPTERRLRVAKPEFLLRRLAELPELLAKIDGAWR